MSKDITYLDYLNLVEKDGIGIDGVKADVNGLCRDETYYSEAVLRSLTKAERDALADGPAGWPANGYVLRFPCTLRELRRVLGQHADAICGDTADEYEDPDILVSMPLVFRDGAGNVVLTRDPTPDDWNLMNRIWEAFSHTALGEEFELWPMRKAVFAASPIKPDWEPMPEIRSHRLDARQEQQREERNSLGRYTLREAAEILASNGERFEPMLGKLTSARECGQLDAYAPGEHAKYYGKTVRDFYEEVYWDDLNDWLTRNEKRIAFRFPPPPVEVTSPNTEPAAPIFDTAPIRTQMHKLKRRLHALSHIIELAKTAAKDSNSYLAVWPELVRLAESEKRPAPLLGYIDGEGVKYQTDKGVKFFTKEALRKQMTPNAR